MSALYLIRHGQAGTRDHYDALSDLGRTQARLLGEHLVRQKIQFSAVYSGALARQQETARQVEDVFRQAGAAAPEIAVDPRWNEFRLEEVYEALAPRLSADDPQFRADYEELERKMQDQNSPVHRSWTSCDTAVMRAWIEGRYAFPGESWAAFQARVAQCRDTLSRRQSGETVAVFTSATPMAIWVGLALGLNGSKLMRIAGVTYNAAITTLRVDEQDLTLFSFNGVPHLSEPHLRTFR